MISRMLDNAVKRLSDKPSSWAGGVTYEREWIVFRRRVKFEWKTSDGWSRFGGGWNWKLGFQVGGSTVILNLLFCMVRIDLRKR